MERLDEHVVEEGYRLSFVVGNGMREGDQFAHTDQPSDRSRRGRRRGLVQAARSSINATRVADSRSSCSLTTTPSLPVVSRELLEPIVQMAKDLQGPLLDPRQHLRHL